MDVFSLSSTIDLNVDKAMRGFSQAQTEARKTSDAFNNLDKSVSNSATKMTKFDKAMDRHVTNALKYGTLALGAFGVKSIDLASNLQEVQNVVDTTFGSNASKINKWAKDAAESFGMSELQAKKFNGTMGAMLKSMGMTSNQTYDMSTKMVGLAGDMASFYNLDHEEAFTKIRAGISGETEPLKQLGINLSVANLEAYALTQGINKQWKEMSEAEKTMIRYNYILSVSKDAQGDFAKTSDSFANKLRILKLKFTTLATEIGEKLLPYADKFITWLTDNIDKLPLMVGILGSLLVGFKGLMIISQINMALQSFRKAQVVANAATKATTGSTWALNSALLANPIFWIIGLIMLLIGAFVYLWNTNEDFRKFWIGVWEDVSQFFVDCWNSIIEFFTVTIPAWIDSVIAWFEGIPQWFSELPYKIGYALGQALAQLVQWGIDSYNWVTTEVPKIIDEVIKWFSELPGRIANWLKESVNKLIQWGIEMYPIAIQAVSDTITGILDWFGKLPSKIYNVGSDIVEGLWNGIIDMKDWLWGKITGFCDGILDGFLDFFDINSPSRLFKDMVGTNLVKGIEVGINTETPNLSKLINDDLGSLTSSLRNTMDYEVAMTTASIANANNTNHAQTMQDSNQSSFNEIYKLLQAALNRPISVNIDGREAMIALSPYQNELANYYNGR
ncbi:MAG: phage tail protein [Peptostreptococcaceae bacterium]